MPRNRTSVPEGARDPRLVEIGDRLKQRRLSLGLEQKDVAQLVQVTEKTVSNWEIGQHSPAGHLGKLAAALGVSEGWIWEGEGKALDTDRVCKLLEDNLRVSKAILDQIILIREHSRLSEGVPY